VTERTHVPRLGKEKVAVALREAGHDLSDSTVGRMIGDLKKTGRLPKNLRVSFWARTGHLIERKTKRIKKIRRPKAYTEQCLEVDTIVRFIDGIKRYTLTATDISNKFAFAFTYKNHSSSSAADFLHKVRTVSPFDILSVQTDNGSEFADHFRTACEQLDITHFHTYPRCPKMNACIERFNRSLSEEFLEWNRPLLRDDLVGFNRKLIDYLVWFNTKRPHHSLGLVSPLRYIVAKLSAPESHMCWTNTLVQQVSAPLLVN
jgi:transposase InsO family protein